MMTATEAARAPASPQEVTYRAVGAFVDALVQAGAVQFCVCPGSRSTPLAITIARHPGARLWMHLDERSAGFFALGLAKASGAPAVLVCTSGTAAANFMPAVVEAYYSRVPLVVLTADRPPELRDVGAPQAIDQIHLFGRHARWFFDLPLPEEAPAALAHLRGVASRAVATAMGSPAGPVHLNCPYREPLTPPPGWRIETVATGAVGGAARPDVTVAHGPGALALPAVEALAAALADAERGLIVCGPGGGYLPASVAPLAARLGYPILADPLSGVRCGRHDRSMVLDAYDAFLRDPHFSAAQAPAVVLRFGAMPVSKPLLLYLQRHQTARHLVVDGDGGWNDPAGLATEMLHVDGATLCTALTHSSRLPAVPRQPSRWHDTWRRANHIAGATLARELAAMAEPFEGRVFAELAEILPAGAALFVGNSMPVRDLDTFFGTRERPVRLLANRGANGIDGVVSSALGAAAAGLRPLVLVIGDLSFYHDSNGLLAAKQHGLDATIVLLNNDGGGIFSFLPQAGETSDFETLFGTPHGLDFRPLAETYGATFTRPRTWAEFRDALGRSIGAPGLSIVELRTARDRNVTLHRELWQAVSRALSEA